MIGDLAPSQLFFAHFLCQAERMLQSYPRVFRPSGGWPAVLAICSLLGTVGGAAGTWYFGTGHEAKDPQGRFLLTGFSVLFFGLGVYLLLSLWRSKIVLTEDRIEIHELTRVRSLQKNEILGWRLVPTAYVAVWNSFRAGSTGAQTESGLAL